MLDNHGVTVLITETFESIQGEGPMIGMPMMFVRTNRCNLRCTWCDSTYTFSGGHEYPVEYLLSKVSDSSRNWVCFTGGEPLIQRDAITFIQGVVDSGKKVLLETGGSISIGEVVRIENTVIDMDIKTPSSGEEKSLLMENIELLRPTDYIKFVIADDRDFDYALAFLSTINRDIQAVMQPAWGSSLKDLTEKAMKLELNVRILPQLHKIIWGEIPGV